MTLAQHCQQFNINTLYAFGSRAQEASARVHDETNLSSINDSDLDIGIHTTKPLPIKQKVKLLIALEDFFDVARIDLIALSEADPFLAANIIRGERLYTTDEYMADEYDLYVLRRAGDLIPLERERQQLIMENIA